MRQCGCVAGGIVDLDELQVRVAPGRAQGKATHAAEAVDTDANGHCDGL
jgi:hypothetical protein